MARISSLSEKPISQRPRRLAEWLNPTGARKEHSLIDKIYSRKNLAMAWEKVRQNRGAAGMDRQSIEEFEQELEKHLDRLHEELKQDCYQPQPVREQRIPKAGQPGKYRKLGIPTVYDRVCQQAVLNRLEPIFEPVFEEANFGYRRGRSNKDALRKVWRELENGDEWIVDADLRDFFGTVEQRKLMTLITQCIADGRTLKLIESMLQAGCMSEGRWQPTERGVPEGGVISPILSNILLTPFDWEMRQRGWQLTRYADDWIVTCRSRTDAQAALEAARQILEKLGVALHSEKTRIVHISTGFEFLGYKIKRGTRPLRLAENRIKSGARTGGLYAYPREKSIQHFKDQIRSLTRRRAPVTTQETIDQINLIIRGWGRYYCKAHIRKLFNRLDRWIVQRLWSQRHKRWRCCGWKTQPRMKLYGEMGLVNLVALIPSLARC